MGSTFSKQIDILNDPQIKYFHFDFHQECSKMRWHRVSLLLDHFHSDLVSQGYVSPMHDSVLSPPFYSRELFPW